MKRRVVVTGMGAITPIGNNVLQMWQSIQEGACGIAPITRYDTSNQRVKLAGEVKNYVAEDYIDKKAAHRMDRFTQFALIAAREAVSMSGLDMSREDSERIGVIISSGIGGLNVIEAEHSKGMQKGFDRVSPLFIPMVITNMAAGTVAIEFGIKGYSTCVVTACAGGTNAVGDAFRQIRDGYTDVMLCGGTESCVTPLGIGGFTSMRALNETTDANRASIPFDKERNGFVLGEGAGILVLEEYEHAIKRNAKILGEIAGYGATCDSYHMTAPTPDGSGAANCMRMAIRDARITPEDIGYVNAHGTSTAMNDKCEAMAIHNVFKERALQLPVSSTKSMTGHLLGAAGAVESIICLMALKDGFLPATIHYEVPDEECKLDVVPNVGRKVQTTYAMSNSLGFGGHNATLIFKAFSE